MDKLKNVIKASFFPVLLFGSLWGLSELWFGETLAANSIAHKSIYLNVIAIFILIIAKRFVPRLGSMIAIGVVAALFKFIQVKLAGVPVCHVAGIIAMAVSFEVTYLMLKNVRKDLIRLPLTGIIATYMSFVGFGFLFTFVSSSQYWNIDKFIDYVGISAGVVALASIFVVPLGYFLSQRIKDSAGSIITKPAYINVTMFILIAVCWVVGNIAI